MYDCLNPAEIMTDETGKRKNGEGDEVKDEKVRTSEKSRALKDGAKGDWFGEIGLDSSKRCDAVQSAPFTIGSHGS